MKNAQELIDAIKDVPDELFDQNFYQDGRPQCGCVMYHYETNTFGKLVDYDEFNYHSFFELTIDEANYLFGNPYSIRQTSVIKDWPRPEEFTVQSAIERIKFIDSLTKEK